MRYTNNVCTRGMPAVARDQEGRLSHAYFGVLQTDFRRHDLEEGDGCTISRGSSDHQLWPSSIATFDHC